MNSHNFREDTYFEPNDSCLRQKNTPSREQLFGDQYKTQTINFNQSSMDDKNQYMLRQLSYYKQQINTACYLKFQSVGGLSPSFVVRETPSILGSNQSKIKLSPHKDDTQRENSYAQKIAFIKCQSIAQQHLLLIHQANETSLEQTLQIFVIEPFLMDQKEVKKGQIIPVNLSHKAVQVVFPCKTCVIPHVYFLHSPPLPPYKQHSSPSQLTSSTNNSFCKKNVPKLRSIIEYKPRPKPEIPPLFGVFERTGFQKALTEQNDQRNILEEVEIIQDPKGLLFSTQHREALKRAALLFGFTRITKIQKESTLLGQLQTSNLQKYLENFVRMLINSKTQEQYEKTYLEQKLPVQSESDESVDQRFWGGEKVSGLIQQWARRLIILSELARLIQAYKASRSLILSQASNLKGVDGTLLLQAFKSKTNLISWIPEDQIGGTKPAIWWTHHHDTDLIWGVYKYGFGNYSMIKDDNDFCWGTSLVTEKNPWPAPEKITVRLKRIIQMVKQQQEFDFKILHRDDVRTGSGLSINQKTEVIVRLQENGLVSGDGYAKLLHEVAVATNERINSSGMQLRLFCESAVQESQQMIKQYTQLLSQDEKHKFEQQFGQFKVPRKKDLCLLERMPKLEDLKWWPDGEDISFTVTVAFKLIRRTALISFVRDKIAFADYKLYKDGFQEGVFDNKAKNWTVPDDDLILIKAVDNHGLLVLNNMHEHGLQPSQESRKQKLLERLEHICITLKKHQDSIRLWQQDNNSNSHLKHAGRPLDLSQSEFSDSSHTGGKTSSSKKKGLVDTVRDAHHSSSGGRNHRSNIQSGKDGTKEYRVGTPVKVGWDCQGNPDCPIQITANLRVLNWGTISSSPSFHTTSNIYPIGFKSIRTGQSLYHLGGRADYTNEILKDKNGKIMFKVTCSEDPNDPYLKDNCSGIWCDIIKRINAVTKARQGDKISISGPQMFGIAEYQVQQILQQMNGVEKLANYKFKIFK